MVTVVPGPAVVGENDTIVGEGCVMFLEATFDEMVPSLTWNEIVRGSEVEDAFAFAYFTLRKAVWYFAIVALPVSVRTPVVLFHEPEIPFAFTYDSTSLPV